MVAMAEVALVVHHERSAAAELAAQAMKWLTGRGHRVRLPAVDAKVLGWPDLGVDADTLAKGLDLAVSLGGDGTMLRCVDLVSDEGVPVLGVNVGQLGYLAEVEPDDLDAALARLVAGE